MTERILVVCAGNRLVADDGAGPAVFDRLSHSVLPPGVRLEEVGCIGIGLVDNLRGQQLLVVIDAVAFGSAPGTVHVLEWEALPRACRAAISVHGLHLRESIDVARRLDPANAPHRVVLVGIEGRCFDQLGTGLSPEVAAAVEEAVQTALALVAGTSGPMDILKEALYGT